MTIDEFESMLIDEVEDFVKNTVKIYDLDFELGEDFCWWPKVNLITMSILFSRSSEQSFMNYCVSLGLDKDLYSSFGLSLLHELGHVKTYYTFTKTQIKEYEENKYQIETTEMDADTRNIKYFSLPIESVATQWAINFIKNHTKEYVNFCFAIQDLCKEYLPQIVTEL